MFRGLAATSLLLAAFLAAGVVIQLCQNATLLTVTPVPNSTARVETPTPQTESQPRPTSDASSQPTVVSLPAPAAQPTAASPANRPVAWLLDGASYAVAVDAQTGQELARTPPLYGYFWFYSAHNASRHYYVQLEKKDNVWQVGLVAIDRERADVFLTIPLDRFAVLSSNKDAPAWFPELFVSPDGRQVFVIVGENMGIQWLTRVYVIDLASRVATPVTAFESGPDQYGPLYRTVLSADGTRLFVANIPRADSLREASLQPTRIAVVNTAEKQIERVIEVPRGGFWPVGARFPDGQTLHLMRSVYRNEEEVGYRFMMLDAIRTTVEFEQQFDDPTRGSRFCGTYGVHFTQDGRELWMLCGDSIQFLDPQSGRTVEKVLLDEGGLDHFNLTYQRMSPDNKLLYVLFTSTNQVFVVDLMQRAVVRQAEFKENKSSFVNPLEWFSQLVLSSVEGQLVNKASAKMVPEPGLLLSCDGQRLYMVDVEGLDSGDGVWGMESRTLKPLGHWLKGKDVMGVQLSEDERELYALSWKERKLYVLDAFNGELRRVFDHVVSAPSGFVE